MKKGSKVKRRLFCTVLTLALIITGIPAPKYAEAAKKKPKLNKKSVKLTEGKTVKLKVKNNKKKVKWSSSKKKVATVSKKGVVKAKKKGTAKIYAKVGKKKLTCKVTVKAKKKKATPKPKSKPTPTSNSGNSSGGSQNSSGGSDGSTGGNQDSSGGNGGSSGGSGDSTGGNGGSSGGSGGSSGGNGGSSGGGGDSTGGSGGSTGGSGGSSGGNGGSSGGSGDSTGGSGGSTGGSDNPSGPTPKPDKLVNPGTITLLDTGESWHSFAEYDASSPIMVTGDVNLQVSCTGISNLEIRFVNLSPAIPEIAFTSQEENVDRDNSIWGRTKCKDGDLLSTASGILHTGMNSIYIRLYDRDTEYYYYLNTPPIYIEAEETPDATPTPTPTPAGGGGSTTQPTPTPDPTPVPATGSEGQNVDLGTKTAFTVKSSSHSASYKLALGMSKSDVNKVLGDLSTNKKRTGKSPQGFDTISFRSDGYGTYILVYMDPKKNDEVVGIFSIGSSGVSYEGVVSSGTSVTTGNDWSPVSWYSTSSGGNGAYVKETSDANVIAFVDALGDKKVYGIQIFSKGYSVDDMTNPGLTSLSLDYSDDVTTEMAAEAGEMINAYLAFCNKGTRYINTDLSKVAQSYSATVTGNRGSNAESEGRKQAEMKTAVKAITGKEPEVAWAELLFIGNMDAIGFVNSVIESDRGRSYIQDKEVTGKSGYRYIGIGVSAHMDGDAYVPNMVIDLVHRYKS